MKNLETWHNYGNDDQFTYIPQYSRPKRRLRRKRKCSEEKRDIKSKRISRDITYGHSQRDWSQATRQVGQPTWTNLPVMLSAYQICHPQSKYRMVALAHNPKRYTTLRHKLCFLETTTCLNAALCYVSSTKGIYRDSQRPDSKPCINSIWSLLIISVLLILL